MHFLEHKLLTDENVSPRVVVFLRSQGFDVLDVKEQGLHGTADVDILQRAVDETRMIVTHDADFGTLAINSGATCFGILYLRLQNQSATSVIAALETFCAMNVNLGAHSIVVLNEQKVRIRLL